MMTNSKLSLLLLALLLSACTAKVYYSLGGTTGTIGRINQDGSAVSSVISLTNAPVADIGIDLTFVYWTSGDQRTVSRVPKVGTLGDQSQLQFTAPVGKLINSSPVVANGKIYIVLTDISGGVNELVSVETAVQGDGALVTIATGLADTVRWTHAVLSGGLIYHVSGSTLASVDIFNGAYRSLAVLSGGNTFNGVTVLDSSLWTTQSAAAGNNTVVQYALGGGAASGSFLPNLEPQGGITHADGDFFIWTRPGGASSAAAIFKISKANMLAGSQLGSSFAFAVTDTPQGMRTDEDGSFGVKVIASWALLAMLMLTSVLLA